MLEVDGAYFRRRNHFPTLRAYGIERRQHFFKIDFPRAWHGYDPALFPDCTARSTVGGFFAFSSGRPHAGQESTVCSVSSLRIFQLARTAASKATWRSQTHELIAGTAI
jgi:hypothetical protein